MNLRIVLTTVLWILMAGSPWCQDASVSEATQECLDCHTIFHPGIVEGWRSGRHAAVTPRQAMAVEGSARKVSSAVVPESLSASVVGCAECHTLRPSAHADTFEHNGYNIHIVVSPEDCRSAMPRSQAVFREHHGACLWQSCRQCHLSSSSARHSRAHLYSGRQG